MTTFYSTDATPSTYALRGIELLAGGQAAAHANPAYVTATNPAEERTVALVSGGGAGHEPMHAGFVGRGGLDAACPGEVFTSPHSRQIFEASNAVAKPGGVLHIVKNYTGDRINFAIAAERLRNEGIETKELVIDDDLGTAEGAVGRRGTAATVVIEKILGAAADRGLGLSDLHKLGEKINGATRSLAVARGAHTPPNSTDPAFTVTPGTLEFGVGIHGETAKEQIEQPSLSELADRMIGDLLGAIPHAPHGVILFANNLGGLAPLELLHVLTAAETALESRGVRIRSAISGAYVTALDMAGFSLTLTAVDEEWLDDWFAPHATVGLPSPRPAAPRAIKADGVSDTKAADGVSDTKAADGASDTKAADGASDSHPAEFEGATEEREKKAPSAWLTAFVEGLGALKEPLNALDQRAGDGDVGTNLAAAAHAALTHAAGPEASLAEDLRAVSDGFLEDTGGSSGPLFGLVFQHLASAAEHNDSLLEGVKEGAEAVSRVGGAKPGDRTIIDALDAAVKGSRDLDEAAARAAVQGAKSTAEMVGSRGRSSYLGERVLGVPDPGALAMAHILTVIAEVAQNTEYPEVHEEIAALLKN